MSKGKEKLTVAAMAGVLFLSASACDSDGDGYDDETGEVIPATASYTWRGGSISSVTYIRHGDNVVMQDVQSNRASVPIYPGEGVAISVTGDNVSCSVSIKGEYASESGSSSARCIVPGIDIW